MVLLSGAGHGSVGLDALICYANDTSMLSVFPCISGIVTPVDKMSLPYGSFPLRKGSA
jgi:hypothetical protein